MKKLNSYSLWIVFITLYYTTAPQIPFGSQTWQFKISHKWTFLWNKIYMGYFPLPRLITRGYFRGCVVLSISEQRMKTSGNRGLGSDLFRHLWLWVKTPMPLVFPNNRDLCMFISPHLHIVLGETTTDQYWTGGEKCWHLGYLKISYRYLSFQGIFNVDPDLSIVGLSSIPTSNISGNLWLGTFNQSW